MSVLSILFEFYPRMKTRAPGFIGVGLQRLPLGDPDGDPLELLQCNLGRSLPEFALSHPVTDRKTSHLYDRTSIEIGSYEVAGHPEFLLRRVDGVTIATDAPILWDGRKVIQGRV